MSAPSSLFPANGARSGTEGRVSIIIPTYNCEAFIAETIGSVLAQTYTDIEVIVVDDGSTDRTREMVAAYGAPVRLIAQSNAGVCAARNRGIEDSTGEFICLMDHDDYWFPDKLEQQVADMRANPELGVAYSLCLWWHPDSSGQYPSPASFNVAEHPNDIDPDFSGWIYHQFLLECCPLTSTAMIRREALQRCGVLDVSLPYSEDWDLFLRISREYQYLMRKRPNTLYRQHPRQGSRIPRPIDYRSRLVAEAARKWGLCSRDGRCISRWRYARQMADFHANFALDHLRAGNLAMAIRSLLKAMVTFPVKLRYSAYLCAALVGWRPKWD